ncbi:hypothetical protein FRC17_003803, partial [Serendipita sp. 399]
EGENAPMPAGGELPGIATSKLLRTTRETALNTPGLSWADDGSVSSADGGRDTRKMNLYQAGIVVSLIIALAKDDNAVVFGEDVAFGGVFRCTMGLAQEYGKERVFNTPLTEQASINDPTSQPPNELPLLWYRESLDLFSDYIYPAFDQIVNEAAKYRYRSGGQFNAGGLTIRTPSMSVGHGGLYHSQSPEGFFLGASGIKIVVPRSPIQAKGLLLASIRDPNPVLFMEPKILYRSSVEQVPISDYILPLSKIETLIPGSDLTLLTYGTPLYTCETALSMLSSPPPSLDSDTIVPKDVRKAKIELIDLRTILPWDIEGVIESVNRTGRLVIVHEAGQIGGVGAEIAAEIQKRCFLRLEAPTPVALQFEKFHIPDAIRVMDAIVETLQF